MTIPLDILDLTFQRCRRRSPRKVISSNPVVNRDVGNVSGGRLQKALLMIDQGGTRVWSMQTQEPVRQSNARKLLCEKHDKYFKSFTTRTAIRMSQIAYIVPVTTYGLEIPRHSACLIRIYFPPNPNSSVNTSSHSMLFVLSEPRARD